MHDARGPEQIFRDSLARGEIRLQQCDDCEKFIFFPRVLCPHCGGSAITWRLTSGKGSVHTTTTVRRRAEKGGDYNVCMIDLAEGVRLMSRVDEILPAKVGIGMPIITFIGEIDGSPAILCRPAGA